MKRKIGTTLWSPAAGALISFALVRSESDPIVWPNVTSEYRSLGAFEPFGSIIVQVAGPKPSFPAAVTTPAPRGTSLSDRRCSDPLSSEARGSPCPPAWRRFPPGQLTPGLRWSGTEHCRHLHHSSERVSATLNTGTQLPLEWCLPMYPAMSLNSGLLAMSSSLVGMLMPM